MAGVLVKTVAGNRRFRCLTACSNPARRFSSQLFVSRLSFYTTNEELRRLFSPFGKIAEARLVVDERTQRPKGFGFITYKSEVEAQKALKAMNGRILLDKSVITVEVVKAGIRKGKKDS